MLLYLEKDKEKKCLTTLPMLKKGKVCNSKVTLY